MGPTPVKSLRASAVVINRTAAQDADWIQRLQAAKERPKQQEAAAQAEAGASAVAGSDPAAQGSGPAEVVVPSMGGAEPGSSSTAEAAVEASMAEASVRDAERADADVVMEEVPPAAGQEAAQPGELQPQQDPPAEPTAMVEGGVDEPPPEVLEGEVPAEESTPATVDPILNDSPLDKGKQVVGVEGVEAVDRAGPSAAVGAAGAAGEAGPFAGPEDAPTGPSSEWPDFTTLALVRAEEEIPRWGGPSLEFRDASNPGADPVFALNDRDEVHHWEYLEGLRRHMDRSLRVVMEAVQRGMRDATEVCFGLSVVSLSFCCLPFSWFSVFFVFLNHDQELKERSRRKSLFIRNESGVWAALARQRALVEEANKRHSDQSAEMAELRVAYAAVKEEAVQAWTTEAVVHEDTSKAREEAAQARKDLEPLSAQVKELEQDVSLVSR
jgi:predicted metal-binding transcription factor (methanogenesis marker protein 9)